VQLGVGLEELVEVVERTAHLVVPALEQRVDRAAHLIAKHVRQLLHGLARLVLLLGPLGRLLLGLSFPPRLKEISHALKHRRFPFPLSTLFGCCETASNRSSSFTN
jgi:hypothetical protein